MGWKLTTLTKRNPGKQKQNNRNRKKIMFKEQRGKEKKRKAKKRKEERTKNKRKKRNEKKT